MKQILHRFLSLVLVAVMLIGTVPMQAFAAEETEVRLPEIEIGKDILDYDVFYLATASASVPENGRCAYLLRVGRGGSADSKSGVLVKIADMTAKYGEDYVVRVRDERTKVDNPKDNFSLMEMIEGSAFEQQTISDSDEFADMMEKDGDARAAYQQGVQAALDFLEGASGYSEKYGDENPYAEALEEGNAENAESAGGKKPAGDDKSAGTEDAGALEVEIEAVSDTVEGAIPAMENGEVITIGGDENKNIDPVQAAANLFTGQNATAQRLTAEGDVMQDLQAIANVMTNVVVGACVELTFDIGETEKYLEIVPKDNKTGDGDRMFYVILGAPSGTTTNSSASSCAFTIIDDEEQAPAVVGFSDAVYYAGGESVTVTVERTGAMNTVVSAAVKTTGEGTAQAGRDYSEVDAELVFPFGVDHLTLDIPVRTDYLTGGGSFGLTLEPTAGCDVGGSGTATVYLGGSYTGKASLMAAQRNRLMSAKTDGVMLMAASGGGGTTTNSLSTYKTMGAVDLANPYQHATMGGGFKGHDYYNTSGFYHTMWKGGDDGGAVVVTYELTKDYWESYFIAGAEVNWWRSYGCSDVATMRVAIAGKRPGVTDKPGGNEYVLNRYYEMKGKNGLSSTGSWFPYDSRRDFNTETRYIYPAKDAIDWDAQCGKNGYLFGPAWAAARPQAISFLNIAHPDCDDCSQLHVNSVKPILRPFRVTVLDAVGLDYLKADGSYGKTAGDTTTMATLTEGGSSAVFFKDDSFTVESIAGTNVRQYGYMSAVQLLTKFEQGKLGEQKALETPRVLATLVRNDNPAVNRLTYTLNADNMRTLIGSIDSDHSVGWTKNFQTLLQKNNDENLKVSDGYPTYVDFTVRPVLNYIDAKVTLRNPYTFPVTFTISGQTITLNGGETRDLKGPGNRTLHKGDTLAVTSIRPEGAGASTYTAVGVRYWGKYNRTSPVTDKAGTWDFTSGRTLCIGEEDNRLNFGDVMIEPNLQASDNCITVRVKTRELSKFDTTIQYDESGAVTYHAGVLATEGTVEGEYTYFTFADSVSTVNGKLYPITATPVSSDMVCIWEDRVSQRTYEGNTLYFTAGNEPERNVITLTAAPAKSSVILQGTLNYTNYNLRTQYEGNESKVPAAGALLTAGSAGGMADQSGHVTTGSIPTSGLSNHYLRYIVSVNGADMVQEVLLPTPTVERGLTMLWDFNADRAMDAHMGANRTNLVNWTGEKDSKGNDYYTFTATGGDPFVSMDIPVSSVNNVQWMKVRIRNLCGAEAMELYSCTGSNSNVRGASCTQIELAKDTEWHEYIINIPNENVKSANAYKGASLSSTCWTGNIKWIRLDPMAKDRSSGGGMKSGDRVQIDYVAFFADKSDAEEFRRTGAAPNLLVDFGEEITPDMLTKFRSGLMAQSDEWCQIVNIRDDDGRTYWRIFTYFAGEKLWLKTPVSDASKTQWAKIRARNVTGQSDVFMELAMAGSRGNANERTKTRIDLAADDQWHEYVVNLSAWRGSSDYVMLTPLGTDSYEMKEPVVEIEYIAYFAREDDARAFSFADSPSIHMGDHTQESVDYIGKTDGNGDSYYTFTASGSDPCVSLDDAAVSDAAKIQWVKLRARNVSGADCVQLWASMSWGGLRVNKNTRVDIPLSSDDRWHEYVVNIPAANKTSAGVATNYWYGGINWIRLHPMAGNVQSGSRIEIDYLAFFENEADARAYRSSESTPDMLWDFNADNAMSDSMGGKLNAHELSYTGGGDSNGNGYYTFTAQKNASDRDSKGDDPYVSVDMSAVSADDLKWVKIRARNLSTAETMQLYACIGDSNIVYGDSRTDIDLYTDGAWHEYVVNIPEANKSAAGLRSTFWNGRINWLRLDPLSDCKPGDKIQIDYIAFFAYEEEARNYRSTSGSYTDERTIDISSGFPKGVSPVTSAIFSNIDITGEMVDSSGRPLTEYNIQHGSAIPIVQGKSVDLAITIDPAEYSYAMTAGDGRIVEATRLEKPMRLQLVVYSQSDEYKGIYDEVEAEYDLEDPDEVAYFHTKIDFVEPEEEEYDEDTPDDELFVPAVGFMPAPGDRLYLRLTTNRLAQTGSLKTKGDKTKTISAYQYSDIYTGIDFYQPLGYEMVEMGLEKPIEIEYANLPFVGKTGMNLNFPFVNVGIMRIHKGYRIYIGVSPVQIMDVVRGTHLATMSTADGQYWKSLFSIKSPLQSMSDGLAAAKNSISKVREAAMDAKANGDKFDVGSLGSPSWRFDIAIGMYFDFHYVTITEGGVSRSLFKFDGLGGYVNISLGFSMAWYIILPVVFLPAYFGIEINGSVLGFLGADFNSEVVIDYDSSLNGNARLQDGITSVTGGIRALASVQISFGVGLCGVLGVRFAGRVDMIGNWEPDDPHGEWGFYITLAAGGIIDLFLFSVPLMYTFPGWSFGSFEYYSDPHKWTVNPEAGDENSTVKPLSASSMLLLREGGGEDSMWLGDQMPVRGAFRPKNDTKILALDTYEHADPQLITLSDGETLALAFIDSDVGKGDAQRTTLKLSVYDAGTGLWSEPVAVSSDGTADFQPSIAETKDGRLLVAWVSPSDSVTDLSTDEGVMAYLNSMEVYAAFVELDGNKQIKTRTDDNYGVCADTEVTRITNDKRVNSGGNVGYYDANPTVVCDMESGDAMIYYIKSGRSSLGDGDIADYINPYTNDCVVCYMPFNAEEDTDTDNRTVPAGWLTDNFYYAEMDGNTANEQFLIENFGGQRFLDGAVNEHNERYAIPDFAAIGYNGLAVYAYTVDTDGSNDTDADKELYLQVYDFRDHETKYRIMLTDDNVADAVPQFFRSKVNAADGMSTEAENTHTKLFWYRNGKNVVYIDVTALLREGINPDGSLKTGKDEKKEYTYVADGMTHYRYLEPRIVYVSTVDSNASAQFADFKAVEDAEGNLYIIWTESVTDEDGNTARELFGSGLIEYQIDRTLESGTYDDKSGTETAVQENVTEIGTSGWSKPYQITRSGYQNDELAVAMSGENLVAVHNRFTEELVSADAPGGEPVKAEVTRPDGTVEEREAIYNGKVDFMPIRITDLALVSDTLEPCGSVEPEGVTLYRVETFTEADGKGGEVVKERRVPATAPMGGETVAIEAELSNNGMNVAEGYKLTLYAVDKSGTEDKIGEVESVRSLAPGNGATHAFEYTLPADVDGLTFKAVTKELRSEGVYYSNTDTYISAPLLSKAAYEIADVKTYQDESGFHAKFAVTNIGNAASSAEDTLHIALKGPANLASQFTEEEISLYSEAIYLDAGETGEFDVPVNILPDMLAGYGFVSTLITVQKEIVEQTISGQDYTGTDILSNMKYADFDLVTPMNMTLQDVSVEVDDSADIVFTMDLGDKFGGKDVTYAVEDLTVAKVKSGKVVGVNGGKTTLYATHAATGATVSSAITVTGERTVPDIEVVPTALSLTAGDESALAYSVSREGTLTWSSSDDGVVTVDENGNVKAVGAGLATVTATLTDAGGVPYTATCTVTVTSGKAPVSHNPGSGAAGSITAEVSSDEGSVTVTAGISGNTAAVTAPTEAQIAEITDRAGETGAVTIDLCGLPENITAVVIPAKTVRAMDEAMADNGEGLTVKLPSSTVTFDAAALASVAAQTAGSDLQLNVEPITESKLTSAQKKAIAALDVQALYDVYLTGNDKRITDFGGGKATVEVAHKAEDGQQPGGFVVWYAAEDGTTEKNPTGATKDAVKFTVTHFSVYAVTYDGTLPGACDKGERCPMRAFDDLDTTSWYHDGVHWALENEIMNGYGGGKFSPNDTTSRAMIVTMLHRFDGEPAVDYAMDFTDVEDGKWYTEAIRRATAEGIVTGYGDGKFGPEDELTREQLATILYRYAKLRGRGFTGTWAFPLTFDDASDVSDWAYEAMCWMIMNGVIQGTGDNKLSPKGSATRAQVATMLMRYEAIEK